MEMEDRNSLCIFCCNDNNISLSVCSEAGWSEAGRVARESERGASWPMVAGGSQCCVFCFCFLS